MSSPDSVFVEAPARLHFGVLDLRGRLGRRFGGLGAAIPSPLCPARSGTGRRRYCTGTRRGPGQRIRQPVSGLPPARRWGRISYFTGAIPSHAGLGSGTQLGLAVARALAELYGSADRPARACPRRGAGKRSAIGTWTFALGGFIVEGGRKTGSEELAPLLARFPFPPSWRCVVAVPLARGA